MQSTKYEAFGQAIDGAVHASTTLCSGLLCFLWNPCVRTTEEPCEEFARFEARWTEALDQWIVVRLHIGPTPSGPAREWIWNRQRLVDAARSAPGLSVNDEALDLLDVTLALWVTEVERSEIFDWTFTFEDDVFLLVATYWLRLGEIGASDREAFGVPPAPKHTEEFTHAVVLGMVTALCSMGPAGQPLLARLSPQ